MSNNKLLDNTIDSTTNMSDLTDNVFKSVSMLFSRTDHKAHTGSIRAKITVLKYDIDSIASKLDESIMMLDYIIRQYNKTKD